MKDFDEGMQLIAAQMEIVKAAQAEIDRLKMDILERFCPVKIGDVVTVNSGDAHKGKKMMVRWVKVRDDSNPALPAGFIATGLLLRGSGRTGVIRAEHYAAP